MSNFNTHRTILADAIETIVQTRNHLPTEEVNTAVINFAKSYIQKHFTGCTDKRVFRKVWNHIIPPIIGSTIVANTPNPE